MDANLRARWSTAAVGIPLLVALVGWGPPWLFSGFIFFLTVGALVEYFALAFPRDRMQRWVGVLFGTGLMSGVMLYGESPILESFGVLLVFGFSLSLFFHQKIAGRFGPFTRTLIGGLYIGYLLPFVLVLFRHPAGRAWVGWLILVILAGDSAAYFVGRRLGKKKLAPAISPGKTVEGAWGYLVTAIVMGVLGGVVLLNEFSWLEVFILAVVLGLLAQIGDLFESGIKRIFAVKDSGNLLPGHGGLLDRLDSLIFPIAFTSAYVRIFHP